MEKFLRYVVNIKVVVASSCETQIDQYYSPVLIVGHHQKQQYCFHIFLTVEFRLMFEL